MLLFFILFFQHFRCIGNCLSLPICYIFFGLVYTIIFKYCWDSFPILVYPTKLKKKKNKTKVKKTTTTTKKVKWTTWNYVLFRMLIKSIRKIWLKIRPEIFLIRACWFPRVKVRIQILKTTKKCKPASWVEFDLKIYRNHLQRRVNIVKTWMKAIFKFRPSFYYYLSSVHYC